MVSLKEWITALRSGEYGQAYGALRMSNRFCCLGVACDLNKVTWENVNSSLPFFHFMDDTEIHSILPPKYILAEIDWRLIERPSQITINKFNSYASNVVPSMALEQEPIYMMLSSLNDGGKSFTEIANFIEEVLINE